MFIHTLWEIAREVSQTIMELNFSWTVAISLLSIAVTLVTFFYKMFDNHRAFKIKNTELLHSCLKEEDYDGKSFVLGNIIESAYSVRIPHERLMRILKHPESNKLFNLYRFSAPLITFSDGHFSLKTDALLGEKRYREGSIIFGKTLLKYFVFALLACVSLVFAVEVALQGSLEQLSADKTVLKFSASLVLSLFCWRFAMSQLREPINFYKAFEFMEIIESYKFPPAKKSKLRMYWEKIRGTRNDKCESAEEKTET